jgi:ubiquinone/menaquinone biosynthesis C-methylase UbiE
MNYLISLKKIKKSFLGGSEANLVVEAIKKNTNTNNISFLDVGIGKGKFLKKIISNLEKEGFNFKISGVDPVKEKLSVARKVFPKAKLSNKKFEDFKSTEKFDVINLTQSFYYLKDKEKMLKKLANLLNEGGILLVTLWSEKDDLSKLNNSIFGKENIYNYTSEKVLSLIKQNKSFSKVSFKVFEGEIDFDLWKKNDQNLEGALNVLARKEISKKILNKTKEKLKKELKKFKPRGKRINVVVIAKKKFTSPTKDSLNILKKRFSKKNWEKVSLFKGDNESLLMGCWEEECKYLERKIIGGKILDVCSGVGIRAIHLGKKHLVTGIELNPKRIAYAEHNKKIFGVEKNVNFLKGNALNEKIYSKLKGFSTILVDTDWRKDLKDPFKNHSINPFETSPRTDELYKILRKKYPSALIGFRVSPRTRVDKFKELDNCVIEEIFQNGKLLLFYVYFKKGLKTSRRKKVEIN